MTEPLGHNDLIVRCGICRCHDDAPSKLPIMLGKQKKRPAFAGQDDTLRCECYAAAAQRKGAAEAALEGKTNIAKLCAVRV
jgi:hypothetical protein